MLKLVRHASLRQLQVFEAVARHKNLSRAADELYLTQPTVSTQLKNLSEAVELPLIEFVGKKMFLTEAGESLYHACGEILRQLDHVDMKVADLKGLKQGHLSVAVITTAKYFAPEVVGRFSQRFPEIDVSIEINNKNRVLERLRNNQDDLYILGHNPPADLGIQAQAFSPNHLYVMAGRDHPLAKKGQLDLEDIAGEPWIMREPGSGIRDATESLFEKHGLKPRVKLELSSNEAIKHTLIGRLGISVLSLHSILLEGADGPISVLNVKGFPIKRKWQVVYLKGKELSVVAQTFLDFLKEEGDRLNARTEALSNQIEKRWKKKKK